MRPSALERADAAALRLPTRRCSLACRRPARVVITPGSEQASQWRYPGRQPMRADLDHLRRLHRRELALAVRILFESFEDWLKTKQKPRGSRAASSRSSSTAGMRGARQWRTVGAATCPTTT